ncbi:hypothetical protein BXZ70DRAFT_1002380 [Cristinia sonorae]|uniref:Aminoglycoside phosphotransferase domain-containing protein n=1 Tax=Cristinia sonorae TaxID=1940300 RepID=A0A8K0UGB8_9AGAR|nr:hypothetical protein BXZ70DRAFT_1002380 [Cristinia sonorae]
MTPTELDHVACQLKGVLQQMRSIKSSTLGSVSGGPYRNRFMPWPYHPTCAFASDTIHFVHGDLLPQNILVEGSTITAIIDWETAGFYPAFWEYCRMHCSQLMTPAWGHVLSHIFPEQDAETIWGVIDAV